MRPRSLLWILIFLFVLPLSTEAVDLSAESAIKSVTVFPDSALVTRSSSIELPPGRHRIILPDIVPEVDENSLRVNLADPGKARLLGAQVEKKIHESIPSERIQVLKDQIQDLEDSLRQIKDRRSLLLDQKKFLDSITFFSGGQIPKDMVTTMPRTEDLQDIMAFLETRRKENYEGIQECDILARETSVKIEALKKELALVSGPQREMTRSITVDISTDQALKTNLSVSYLVRGATWRPLYDARADFEKGEVEMVYYAIIRQTTGEDWNNASVAISTAKPGIGGRMPYVEPWILRPFEPRPLRGAVMEKAAPMVLQTDAFRDEELEAGTGREKPTVTIREKGVAVLYGIPGKNTIPSDGADHKLPVTTQALHAEFEYSSYPRSSPYAYLGTRIRNGPEVQMLSGKVNIFLDGDYTGSSSIDNIAPGEEFDLYLGIDENVKISRDLIDKQVDQTIVGGIPSKTRKTTFTYRLSVENYKSKPAKVKLFEALPVPEDDRIKVEVKKVTLEPDSRDWDERKGIWLWKTELKAGENREISITYVVEHPRDMIVEGL